MCSLNLLISSLYCQEGGREGGGGGEGWINLPLILARLPVLLEGAFVVLAGTNLGNPVHSIPYTSGSIVTVIRTVQLDALIVSLYFLLGSSKYFCELKFLILKNHCVIC